MVITKRVKERERGRSSWSSCEVEGKELMMVCTCLLTLSQLRHHYFPISLYITVLTSSVDKYIHPEVIHSYITRKTSSTHKAAPNKLKFNIMIITRTNLTNRILRWR